MDRKIIVKVGVYCLPKHFLRCILVTVDHNPGTSYYNTHTSQQYFECSLCCTKNKQKNQSPLKVVTDHTVNIIIILAIEGLNCFLYHQSEGRRSACFFVYSSAFFMNFLWSFVYSSARSPRSGCSGSGACISDTNDSITMTTQEHQ